MRTGELLQNVEKKTLETGVSHRRGPLENLRGVRLVKILRDSWRTPEGSRLSLWELCSGNLEGGLFAGDPEGYWEECSRDKHHPPWGPQWEICRELVYRGLEKALEKGPFLHKGPVNKQGGPFNESYER
jgi:hypothetical protein